ncbi:MAG: hypothetical protein PHI86_07720, partial [Candidatus Omnitrophica bacterium]|nr:hypothetical protein [Candidatus Omnitrophota bacterium]
MTKKTLFIFFGILLSASFCFAAETVTITTYYPAPYGVYNVLRLNPNDSFTPGAACTNRGEMYYDSSDSQVYICNGTWQAMGGGSFWRANGNNIENTNTELVAILTNLRLPTTTSAVGVVYRDSDRFLHSFGTNNTFLGTRAGNLTMTGGNNTGIGTSALADITTGIYNTAVGVETLSNLTTGGQNAAVGEWSLYLNTSGSNNATLGAETGRFNISGTHNSYVGYRAGYYNTSSYNVFVGSRAGATSGSSSGTRNVAVGYQAGYENTGSDNILLGYGAGSGSASTGRLIIQNSNYGGTPLIYGNLVSGLVGINTSSPGSYTLYVTGTGYLNAVSWVYSSDARLKKNINYIDSGLSIIE